MTYIDGFVTPVPTAGRDAYLEHCRIATALLREFGATRTVEAWGDDVKDGHITDFRRAVQAAPDETVVFSWIEYPDRATRDGVMARMMDDPRIRDMAMPFDGARMIYGGFSIVVDDGAAPPSTGYVDAFLVPAIDTRQADYVAVAQTASTIFREHGTARLVEAWGDDVPAGERTDMAGAVKLEAGEAVVFSWCEYPDKAARDAAQAGMKADARMQETPADMPFDGRRMVIGGFEVILDERS